jgi:3-oxoacyl-[acyl-carrier-protein] synthase-3
MYTAVIKGTGSYIPQGRLTNQQLERMVVTSDEWIVSHTGISERAVAAPDEATSDLAWRAGLAALNDARLDPKELDMILVATETPDHPFPPVACKVQHMLGCRAIPAFDVHLVCSGFIAALHTAEAYIKLGRYRRILVIGADVLTRITDYTDRTTCILFADGAGAVVLSRGVEEDGAGIIYSELFADGANFDAAIVPGGGSRYPYGDAVRDGGTGAAGKVGFDGESGGDAVGGAEGSAESDAASDASSVVVGGSRKRAIVQDGHRIFRLAVRNMAQTVQHTLEHTGMPAEQLDWLIPHQANQRIVEAVAEQLDFPPDKVISTIRHIGNNSAATIPIALDLAVKDGRIRRGQHVALTAFGAGTAWGSVVLQF